MVRASRFGGAALLVGVLCLATCTTRVGGDYVQPVANPGDEPGQVLPVDLDTGMPMVPPAFPPSFVARVAWRVTRAEGETDAVVHGDGGSGSGDRTLATVYHERKVQAERIDVHSREGKVTATFIILHGKGVCYRVTYDESGESRCVHAPTPGPAVQTRLSHVAASFRGKERVGTIPDDLQHHHRSKDEDANADLMAERWDGAVPGYGTREELIALRERSGIGRFARPIRSVFHRTDGGAVLAVETEYASWNHSGNNNNNLRLDPGLFRPPKDAATRCVHDDSGELSKSLEHRNTLHFNPLYYPRVGGGSKRRRDTSSDEDDDKKLKNSGGTGGSGSSPMGSRRGEGTARRRVVANKDGSKPAAPWESHGVDPAGESKGESQNPDAKTQTGEVKTGSSTRSYSDLLPPGTATSDGNKDGGYLSDRGWVDAGIVDGIPESKDDGSGPPHEYALLGSGSDEL